MYQVTIKWANGAITRALINKTSLSHFNLKACNGAAVSIFKVKP